MEDRPSDEQRDITFWLKEVNYSSTSHENATRTVKVPWDAQIAGTYNDPESKVVRVLFAQIKPTPWEVEAQAEQARLQAGQRYNSIPGFPEDFSLFEENDDRTETTGPTGDSEGEPGDGELRGEGEGGSVRVPHRGRR